MNEPNSERRNDDEDEYIDPEVLYWSKVPAPLRGTLYGHYKASGQTRWLVAFLCYFFAYGLIGIILIAVFTNLGETKKAMSILSQSGWVFTLSCGLFSIGSFASERLHVAISTLIAFVLFLIFHVL